MPSRSPARLITACTAFTAFTAFAGAAGAQPSATHWETTETDIVRDGVLSRHCPSNAIVWYGSSTEAYDCASGISGPFSTSRNDFTSLLFAGASYVSPTPGTLVPKSMADVRVGLDGFTGDQYKLDLTIGLYDQLSWSKSSPIASVGFWPVLDAVYRSGPWTGDPNVQLSVATTLIGQSGAYYYRQYAPASCFASGPQISTVASGSFAFTQGLDAPIVCQPTEQTATDYLLGYSYLTKISVQIDNPTPLASGTICGAAPTPECAGISGDLWLDMTRSSYIGGVSLFDAQGRDITATAWSDLRSPGGSVFQPGNPLPAGPTGPPTTTPEPRSLLMLASGLGLIALGRRRRA